MTQYNRIRDAELNLGRVVGRMAGLYHLRKGKNLGYIDADSGLWIPGRDVVLQEIGPFPNLITDLGLDKLADTSFNDSSSYHHVGTGTVAESVSDTALGTFLASSNTVQSSSEGAQGGAPFYGYRTKTHRFNPGVGTGNISEIAISDQATTGEAFSRALVKDGGGSPTTITKQANEWLDTTYQFRLYPDHVTADGSGTVDYSGVSYDYYIRASSVTNYLSLRALYTQAVLAALSGAYGTAYGSDGALGAVTSTPTGSSQDSILTTGASIAADTYSNGTFNRDCTLTIGLNEANTSGGVKALSFLTAMGAYQVLFDPIVPKNNTKVWNFLVNLAWGRATIP